MRADRPACLSFTTSTPQPGSCCPPDGYDLPRNTQGIALIGDPRNDVHLFVSQLHLAFLRVHNGLVDRLRVDGVVEAELFDAARRALTWHYQWIVVHDFLPRVVGRELVATLLRGGPQRFRPALGRGFIPLGFADAAYRYGHAQIRNRYRIKAAGPELRLFPDAIGFGRVGSEHAVGWEQLFDMPGHQPAQRSKRIDGRLPPTLMSMPNRIAGAVAAPEHRSLAVRDLLRGNDTGLPAGETVAEYLGCRSVGSTLRIVARQHAVLRPIHIAGLDTTLCVFPNAHDGPAPTLRMNRWWVTPPQWSRIGCAVVVDVIGRPSVRMVGATPAGSSRVAFPKWTLSTG
jgi:hypothetical protein